MADPHKDKVVLFLPMEGSHNGSTVFNDRTGKIVTVNGNTNLSTAITPPWGKTSAYFDGNLDYLQFAHDTSWGIGNGDFTVEFWLRVVSWGVSGYVKNVVGTYSFGTTEGGTQNDGWQLGYEYSTGTLYFGYGLGAAWTTVASISGAAVLDTWAHFAVTRQGSTVRMFKDGVIGATATDGTNFNRPKTKLNVGCRSDAGTYKEGATVYGYIKDLRITKGVARYTGNFSISQNTKLDDQYWNKTELAIHGEGTGTTFTDASNNNFTVTTNGNATHSTAVAPPFGTSSIYFDGSGDYLSTSSNSIWQFGTGDFTVEAWVYIDPTGPNYQHIWTIGSQTSGDTFKFANTGNYAYYISHLGTTTPCTTSNNSVIFNTWHHIAYVRRNGIFYIFINGVLDGYNASYTGTSIGITSTTNVGFGHTGEYFKGYIKDLRVTKGIARYTQNFNPWKVQDQYYKDSVLLISGEGSGTTFTDGSFNSKTITTSGNTTHSTAVNPPFGTSSIYFDGTGDYLSLADSDDWSFGVGDFTIELWARFAIVKTTAGNYSGLVAHDDTSDGATRGWLLIQNGDQAGKLSFTVRVGTTSYNAISDSVPAVNTWMHIAVVRHAGQLVMYVDGAAQSTTASIGTAEANESTRGAMLGAFLSGGTAGSFSYLNGYIKDLRIIKGVAKYTSDFTPVKSPAQTKSNGIPVTFPDKTGIKTIVKPLQWNEPEQDRVMI